VENRVIELSRDYEKPQLMYAQALQRSRALETELNSESSTIARDYQASQFRDRIFELQSQIETLRLSYTDDYPDIVRLNQQIEDVRAQANRASLSSAQTRGNRNNTANSISPVYQRLRADLATAKGNTASLLSRRNQLKVLLDKEIQRSATTSQVERQYKELVRDYERNKQQYDELAQAQDDARLAMVVSQDKQGVLYRIAEPANFPQNPSGLRFIHIASVGLLVSLLLPLFYLVVFLKLDPRIRTQSAVTELLELPLLTTVPHMPRPKERKSWLASNVGVATVVASVFVVYMVVALVKFGISANLIGGGVA